MSSSGNFTQADLTLIADSGATKTAWAIIGHDSVATFSTLGINASTMSRAEIAAVLWDQLVPNLNGSHIAKIYFYGAGCAGEETCELLRSLLCEATGCREIFVESDMLAAARALCGNRPGIACILGTGSNSCSYDGREIVANVSPLGFILGDEGSGAYLGKLLIGDILKHQLPEDICRDFAEHYHLDRAEIVSRVYRQSAPGRFLASFAPFYNRHINRPEIESRVVDAFVAFIHRNVMQYDGCREIPVGFVGSIAANFEPQLRRAAALSGINIGKIIASPLEALIEYHK